MKPLLPAQLAALRAIAHGETHGEYAARTGMSRVAVTQHLKRARLRMGAETVAEAVHLATRAGWIPDATPAERSA